MLCCLGSKSFICALKYSLSADVNPAPCGHLAKHCEASLLQLSEVIPVSPLRDYHCVRDQDSWSLFRRLEYTNGLSRLNNKCFIILELSMAVDNGIKRFPASCCFTCPPVNYQLLRVLCHFRIYVVHQHSKSCFLLPSLARYLSPSRRPYHPFQHTKSTSYVII